MKLTFNILGILGIKKEKIKKVPWFLGANAFSIILILITLNIIFGIFLFYQYIVLVETKEQEIVQKPIKFEYGTYQEILIELEAKERKLLESEVKNYLNPFTSITGGQKSLENT